MSPLHHNPTSLTQVFLINLDATSAALMLSWSSLAQLTHTDDLLPPHIGYTAGELGRNQGFRAFPSDSKVITEDLGVCHSVVIFVGMTLKDTSGLYFAARLKKRNPTYPHRGNQKELFAPKEKKKEELRRQWKHSPHKIREVNTLGRGTVFPLHQRKQKNIQLGSGGLLAVARA
eukprot:1143291-Pelagomonas_calceolata.AAC.2